MRPRNLMDYREERGVVDIYGRIGLPNQTKTPNRKTSGPLSMPESLNGIEPVVAISLQRREGGTVIGTPYHSHRQTLLHAHGESPVLATQCLIGYLLARSTILTPRPV